MVVSQKYVEMCVEGAGGLEEDSPLCSVSDKGVSDKLIG